MLSLDGTTYYSSSKIYCPSCLVKNHRNGNTTYSHLLLHSHRPTRVAHVQDSLHPPTQFLARRPEHRRGRRLIDAVRTPHNKAFFWTVYSLGLRLQEALNLQVGNIDSARMVVHVHRGKGAKDR